MSTPPASADASRRDPWDDVFSGRIMGTPAALQLATRDGRLHGHLDAGGYRYKLDGSVSGDRARGHLRDRQTLGVLPYRAALLGNRLIVIIDNPAGGESRQFQFTRGHATGGLDAGVAVASELDRDGRLVGQWTYTHSYTSGSFGFFARWTLTVLADGTIFRSEGRVAGGGPGIGADTGPEEGLTRGWWGTRDGVLYVSAGTGWQPHCRYSTNASSLLMRFADGTSQLWLRGG